jgi:hypothetical protein
MFIREKTIFIPSYVCRNGLKYVIPRKGYVWEEKFKSVRLKETCSTKRWESSKERDHSEDQGVGGRKGSEWILGKLAWGVWIGFEELRTVTGGRLL